MKILANFRKKLLITVKDMLKHDCESDSNKSLISQGFLILRNPRKTIKTSEEYRCNTCNKQWEAS